MKKNVQSDPETVEALRRVLTAGKPGRFKILTVACPRDHVLARVYRTSIGLVVVHEMEGVKAERPPIDIPGVGSLPAPPIEGPRGEIVAYPLDAQAWPMQCRCSTWMPRNELQEAIAAGKKRLLVTA